MTTIDRIKYYLVYAMGRRPKDAIRNKAYGLRTPIFDHVLKLTLFGNKDVSWVKDIIDWLEQIHDHHTDNVGKYRLAPAEYYRELFVRDYQDSRNWRIRYKTAISKLEETTKLKSRFSTKDWQYLYELHSELYKSLSEELAKPTMDLRYVNFLLNELAECD